MKVLNLTSLANSDIKYKISKFPDGQQNIVIDNNKGILSKKLYLDKKQYSFEIPIESVQIKSRLNNWLDLELIICAVASLRELGVEEIHLYTPYIVGARSDRKFENGGNNYLKDVICPVINSLNFKTVTCIDPHSDILEACIKGFRKEDNCNIFRFALSDLNQIKKPNDVVFISPDAGASKKIYKTLEKTGWNTSDIITCSKDRDTDGKLTKTVVPIYGNHFGKDLIIIDDICDGGATFINIAKSIKEKEDGSKFKGKLYLIVTHGIFSNGLGELSKYFDGIYCTNSYSELDFRLSLNRAMNTEFPKDFVKQLSVF